MSSNVSHLHVVASEDERHDPRKPNGEWRMHGRWKPDNRTLEDPVAQKGIDRQLARVWGTHLSNAEYRLLHHIIDQTVGWGKLGRHFTHRHLAGGNGYTGGTGKSRSQTSLHLASLERKGFILVDRTEPARGMYIEPNLDWEPPAATPIRETDAPATEPNVQVRYRQRPSVRTEVTTPALTPTITADIIQTLGSTFGHPSQGQWPHNARVAVARRIVAICASNDWQGDASTACHVFAHWLGAVWPEIRRHHGTSEYPDARFIFRQSDWLSSQFRTHTRR